MRDHSRRAHGLTATASRNTKPATVDLGRAAVAGVVGRLLSTGRGDLRRPCHIVATSAMAEGELNAYG